MSTTTMPPTLAGARLSKRPCRTDGQRTPIRHFSVRFPGRRSDHVFYRVGGRYTARISWDLNLQAWTACAWVCHHPEILVADAVCSSRYEAMARTLYWACR